MKERFQKLTQFCEDIADAAEARADYVWLAMQKGYENAEEEGWAGFETTLDELDEPLKNDD